MTFVRVFLATLALLEAPGIPAYAQFAKAVPVRAVPVTAAPVQLRLPLGTAPSSFSPFLPTVAPSLTVPTLPSAPSPSLKAPAAAAYAPAASLRIPGAAAADAAVAIPSSRPLPPGRERETAPAPTAQETLQAGVESLRSPGAGPAPALEAFFSGAKPRAENAVSEPSGPRVMARSGLAPSTPWAGAAPTATPAPKAEDAPDVKALTGLFASRTLSIASFILTSIAYPFLAVPVVGWDGFGALMAFGPLAAVLTGPLNGLIAQRLSARNAMTLNAAVRAGLALILPVAGAFGVLNFWTLLGASVANGWIMNSVMTTEGTYMKRLAGEKRLGTVNALAWMNYLAIQVVLGLIVGVGAFIDTWNPSAAFYISAGVHGLLVLPLLWLTMPNLAPPAAHGPLAGALGLKERAASFMKRHRLPLAAAAAAAAAYAAWGTTLPLVAASLFWVVRTEGFKALWSGEARADSPEETLMKAERDAESDPARRASLDAALALRAKRLRHAMLYLALAALFMFPLQYFVLPAVAVALAGAAGKGLVLGHLLGALFLGNLISVAGRANLPDPKVPGVGTLSGKGLLEGAVVALAIGWSLAALLPGSLAAAAAVGAATLVLMRAASALSETGWLKLMGAGFALIAVPFFAWAGGTTGALLEAFLAASLVAAGMVYGPAFVALNTYFQRWVAKDRMGPAIGAQGAFFNGAVSLGYGLVALAASAAPLPGLLGWMALAFALLGVLFWLAPRLLPGLPASMFAARPKA